MIDSHEPTSRADNATPVFPKKPSTSAREELQQFLSEVQTTERKVMAKSKDETVSWSAPVYNALLYSRFAALLFVVPTDSFRHQCFRTSIKRQASHGLSRS